MSSAPENTVPAKHQSFLAFDYGLKRTGVAVGNRLMKSATPLKALKAPHYPLKPGSYTQVAPLKSAKGAQSYTLPAGVDHKAYGSVLIWCKVANATMAWAPLH